MATSLPVPPAARSPLVRRLVSLLGGLAMLAVLLWVYPTPYAYYGDYRSGLVRIHRITQDAQLLTRTGWLPLAPDAAQRVAQGTDTVNPFRRLVDSIEDAGRQRRSRAAP